MKNTSVSPSNSPLNSASSHTTQADIVNNSMPTAKKLPQAIDLAKWEDTEFTWSGKMTPADFTRLDDIITEQYLDVPIDVSCRLYKQNNVLWLTMDFEGEVWLICQRCLQPLAIDVTQNTELALLYDESQQSVLDEDDDFVLLDEVITDQSIKSLNIAAPEIKDVDDYRAVAQSHKTTSKMLPIAKLIEDELLLDVPLSPKHDDCEMILEQVGEIIEEKEENPFAVLAALKDKL